VNQLSTSTSYATTYLIIILLLIFIVGNNVSIQITVDPLNATERPDIKFLGSERAIIPFQESLTKKFQVRLQEW
jgi:hypothetical protein